MYVPNWISKPVILQYWGGSNVTVSTCIFLLYLHFSLSLSQFQPIFVLFVGISAVLCHCFKAMSLVRILPYHGLYNMLSEPYLRWITNLTQILAFQLYFNNKKCTLYLRNDYLVYHFSGNLNLMFFFVFLYHHHNSLHHHPHGAFSFSFPLLLDAAQPFECEWCKSYN